MTPDPASGVDVVIEAPQWRAAGLEALAMRACGAALTHLGCPGAEVVILGCDDDRIAALNADFRGKPQPTNVLSFPAHAALERPDGTPAPPFGHDMLGDIAIAWGVCAAEAAQQGKTFADHVTHLLIHAVLHLVGYDHETDADAELMEATECAILAGLGISDPYSEAQTQAQAPGQAQTRAPDAQDHDEKRFERL